MRGQDRDKVRPPERSDIPERIRARRKALNLTGSELAEKARVSPSWISLIESHQKVPSEETAARIAEALGENADEFRIWAGKARMGEHTAAWLDQLEGWHLSWVSKLLHAGEREKGQQVGESLAVDEERDEGRSYRAGAPTPERLFKLESLLQMSASLETSEEKVGGPDSPGSSRTVTVRAWAPVAEPGMRPAGRGEQISIVLTVPLISPEYPLSPSGEFPQRAIIGNVPLNVRTLRGTSGRLVALELTGPSAAFVSPRLSPGDLVIVDLEDREPPSSGGSDLIFLVRGRRGTLFSRCALKDRFLILTPEDPSMLPEVLEPADDPSASSPVIGRVVWSARSYSR